MQVVAYLHQEVALHQYSMDRRFVAISIPVSYLRQLQLRKSDVEVQAVEVALCKSLELGVVGEVRAGQCAHAVAIAVAPSLSLEAFLALLKGVEIQTMYCVWQRQVHSSYRDVQFVNPVLRCQTMKLNVA